MKTDRELTLLFVEMVDSQPLPPSAWGGAAVATNQDIEWNGEANSNLPWPEDIGLPALSQAAGLAAGLLLAGSLTVSQATGWVNPLDVAAGRFFAQESVKARLMEALRQLSEPIGSYKNNGEVHGPEADIRPLPQGERIESA